IRTVSHGERFAMASRSSTLRESASRGRIANLSPCDTVRIVVILRVFADLSLHRETLLALLPQLQRLIDDRAPITPRMASDVSVDGVQEIRVERCPDLHAPPGRPLRR